MQANWFVHEERDAAFNESADSNSSDFSSITSCSTSHLLEVEKDAPHEDNSLDALNEDNEDLQQGKECKGGSQSAMDEIMGVYDVDYWNGKLVEYQNSLKRSRVLIQKSIKVKHSKKSCQSMMNHRHFRPTLSREIDPSNLELRSSFAIYSIQHYMVTFSNVERTQMLCLKALSLLLHNEAQRCTARESKLADVITRGMAVFTDNVKLQTASLHCIVLLARPLGGRDGMLSRSSVRNEPGIFCAEKPSGSHTDDCQRVSRNIAVMLNSMRRFIDNGVLQAVGCWSLVNVCLVPEQKEIVIKLGGIDVTVDAMAQHANNTNVQFRGLRALINLVIPLSRDKTETLPEHAAANISCRYKTHGIPLDRIVRVAVTAMTNLCGNESILQNGCSVLYNISLSKEHHFLILTTPKCYQMLDWCFKNYWANKVLRRQASSILRRLQETMSKDDDLREEFEISMQVQKKRSTEKALSEANLLQLWQQRLKQEEHSDS